MAITWTTLKALTVDVIFLWSMLIVGRSSGYIVANCQHLQICQPFSNHHDFLLVVVGWHLLGCTWVAAKTLLSCIKIETRESAVCARSKCAEKSGECNCESECKWRFERKECKSETLVFMGCIGLSWVFVSFLQ